VCGKVSFTVDQYFADYSRLAEDELGLLSLSDVKCLNYISYRKGSEDLEDISTSMKYLFSYSYNTDISMKALPETARYLSSITFN
jgi:hypothetical protein